MCAVLNEKYFFPFSDFNQSYNVLKICERTPDKISQKFTTGSRVVPCGRTDGRTDRVTCSWQSLSANVPRKRLKQSLLELLLCALFYDWPSKNILPEVAEFYGHECSFVFRMSQYGDPSYFPTFPPSKSRFNTSTMQKSPHSQFQFYTKFGILWHRSKTRDLAIQQAITRTAAIFRNYVHIITRQTIYV